MFSKQKLFCRVCGKEMYCHLGNDYSASFCSTECGDEFQWIRALSILGKEYYKKENQKK